MEARLPRNGGSMLRGSGSASRDRHGSGTSHRCGARAQAPVSGARGPGSLEGIRRLSGDWQFHERVAQRRLRRLVCGMTQGRPLEPQLVSECRTSAYAPACGAFAGRISNILAVHGHRSNRNSCCFQSLTHRPSYRRRTWSIRVNAQRPSHQRHRRTVWQAHPLVHRNLECLPGGLLRVFEQSAGKLSLAECTVSLVRAIRKRFPRASQPQVAPSGQARRSRLSDHK
jgi:hypothetical protein